MIWKFLITLLFLILIFVFAERQQYLLASLAASFPSFTFLTYWASKNPKDTALYLALFTLIISITMFIVYFLRFSQLVNTLIGIGIWFVFATIIVYFFYIRNGGKFC